MQDVRIISARRSFEFKIDRIRLTLLTMPRAVDRIRQTFEFQLAQVGTPPALFGPVPNTFPPGLVLNYGVLNDAGKITVIRFVHIEAQRVVIDVAGYSDAAEAVFGRLYDAAAEFIGPDGKRALDRPDARRDVSEIAFQSGVPLSRVVSPLVRAAERVVGSVPEIVAPVLVWRPMDTDQEVPGLQLPNPNVYQLEVRSGTRPSDHIYYSSAPLPTDKHLEYLEQVERELSDMHENLASDDGGPKGDIFDLAKRARELMRIEYRERPSGGGSLSGKVLMQQLGIADRRMAIRVFDLMEKSGWVTTLHAAGQMGLPIRLELTLDSKA